MWSGRKNNRCEIDGLFDWHWLLFNFSFTLFHFISRYLIKSVGTVVPSRDGPTDLNGLFQMMVRAVAGLLSVFAEFERDLLRERVKWGLENARKKGIRIRRLVPFFTSY